MRGLLAIAALAMGALPAVTSTVTLTVDGKAAALGTFSKVSSTTLTFANDKLTVTLVAKSGGVNMQNCCASHLLHVLSHLLLAFTEGYM